MQLLQPSTLVKVTIGLLPLLAASLLLPFIQFTSIIVIALTCLSLLAYKQLDNELLKTSWPSILFYTMLLCGLLYSENKGNGFKILEMTASFVAFPLIFMNRNMASERLKKITLNIFLAATSLFCIYTFTKSFFYPKEYFYYNMLSFGIIHHAYLGVYCCFSIVITLDKVIKANTLRLKILFLLLIAFLVYYLLLLGARTSLFTALLGVAVYITLSTHVRLRLKKYAGIALILLIGISALFVSDNKKLKYRYYHLFEKSLENRLNLWEASLSIIRENLFFGVGTGDAGPKLLERYQQRGLEEAFTLKYNTHNQYLDTVLRVGLVGFLPLAAYLFLSLFYALKHHNLLYLSFLIICFVAFLTEVILIRQKGIVFFMLFNSLFLAIETKRSQQCELLPNLFKPKEPNSKQKKLQ